MKMKIHHIIGIKFTIKWVKYKRFVVLKDYSLVKYLMKILNIEGIYDFLSNIILLN